MLVMENISRESLSETESALSNGVDAFIKLLAPLESGSKRSSMIDAFHILASDLQKPLKPEITTEVIRWIDKSPIYQDRANFTESRMIWIARNLGFPATADLLTELTDHQVIFALGHGLGFELGLQKSITKDMWTRVTSTPQGYRVSILQGYGKSVHFSTLNELIKGIKALPLERDDQRAIFTSYMNEIEVLLPNEFINTSLLHDDSFAGRLLFKKAIEHIISENSQEASEYLSSSRETLPRNFYQEGASSLLAYFQAAGDKKSAERWKKEIPGKR